MASLGKEAEMDVQTVIAQARDALTVERVFGAPYEKNGVTVFPVAAVRAGGGGGGGPTGGGGGGIEARPAGAVVPAPRSRAFGIAAQPENMPLWNRGVLESRVGGPLEKGALVTQICEVYGRRFETLFEVTCFQPPRRVVFTSVRGPMAVRGTM